MLDIGKGYDGFVGWGRGYGPWKKARTFAISILATQCINNMNRVTKCRFTLRRILLCKWSVKMRGNCWLRCHVYMMRKPLIQKYIHVCHPDNWNTHNHQYTDSRQNTQTHTQSTEIHKPANPLKLPNSLDSWYTQTAQPREALRPLSSLKYPTQIHLNMQLT